MQQLPHILSFVGLIVGALDYALLVRRRRRAQKALDTAASSGLRGLVRVMTADYRGGGVYSPE